MDINVLLFDNFEVLDVFGPVEILAQIKEYNLKYYSINGGNIKSAQGTIIVTDKIQTADKKGILVIPGGKGTRALINDPTFISILKVAAQKSTYCLSICTGSALLAKTGLLNGKDATSNIKAFEWVKSTNQNVNWIENARWVVTDKYYTSAGVSAGMDMTLGFIKDRFDEQKALEVAEYIEYTWNHTC